MRVWMVSGAPGGVVRSVSFHSHIINPSNYGTVKEKTQTPNSGKIQCSVETCECFFIIYHECFMFWLLGCTFNENRVQKAWNSFSFSYQIANERSCFIFRNGLSSTSGGQNKHYIICFSFLFRMFLYICIPWTCFGSSLDMMFLGTHPNVHLVNSTLIKPKQKCSFTDVTLDMPNSQSDAFIYSTSKIKVTLAVCIY